MSRAPTSSSSMRQLRTFRRIPQGSSWHWTRIYGIEYGTTEQYCAAVQPKLNLRWAVSSAILCGVINPDHFDDLRSDAVNRDIGHGRKQNLAGTFLTSRTASPRPFLQLPDSAVKLPQSWVAVARMVFFEVIANALQVRCGGVQRIRMSMSATSSLSGRPFLPLL